MRPIYFTGDDRWHALNLVTVYSDEFENRVLATIESIIEIERQAESQAYAWGDEQREIMAFDDGIPEDRYRDIVEGIEKGTTNVYDRIYAEMSFVKNQIVGLAIAGLYHLWERVIKDFFMQECPHIPAKAINGASFEKVIELLTRSGWNIQSDEFYPELDILHLVANVIKHGSGKSYNELVTRAPQLFGKSLVLSRIHRSAGHLELSANDFRRLRQPVRQFFEQMDCPSNMYPTALLERSIPRQKATTYEWYNLTHPSDNSGASQVCELDHLVSLELGGADTLDNIWPHAGLLELRSPSGSSRRRIRSRIFWLCRFKAEWT